MDIENIRLEDLPFRDPDSLSVEGSMMCSECGMDVDLNKAPCIDGTYYCPICDTPIYDS